MTLEQQANEVAIVTAYIQSNNLLRGSFFQTIDLALKIAKEFVSHYEEQLPEWDSSKINLEFDEAIESFVKKNVPFYYLSP